MTGIRNSRRWKCWLLCTWAAVAASARAQFVEINAEFDGISRGSNSATGKVVESRRTYHIHCVVGTNRWMIDGDFALNAQVTYWFTGSNIIERSVITPLPLKMRIDRAERQIAGEFTGRKPAQPFPIGVEPKVGEHFAGIINSTGLNQPGGGFEKVPWLAFCSGPYLRSSGREVPLPIGVNPAFSYTRNTSDDTTVFPDALGLPKRIELRTADNHFLCEYKVEQTTNVLGWTFPMRFKIVQYGPNRNSGWWDGLHAEGKVISIQKGKEPLVPDDVLKDLHKR